MESRDRQRRASRRALRLLARRARRRGCTSDARIPPRYRACDLETFLTYPNDKLIARGAARPTFRRRISGGEAAKKGLCLIGPPGIGKTHLAVAVLRRVILTRGARGLFYDTRDLLRLIRSTYNPLVRTRRNGHPASGHGRRPARPRRSRLRIKPSEWVEETMNLIVNTRYNERRPTIFTTQFRGAARTTTIRKAQVAHRVPDPLAAVRDVRVPRVRRRRLPPPCRQTAASTTW